VPNHVYEARRNLAEADEVIRLVLKQVNTHPNRSLGIAAVNSTQSYLIDELLYAEEGKHLELRAFRKNGKKRLKAVRL
jgi:hypothetical protein